MRALDTLRECGFENRLANRYLKASPERNDLNHPRHSRTKQGTQDTHGEVVRAGRANTLGDAMMIGRVVVIALDGRVAYRPIAASTHNATAILVMVPNMTSAGEGGDRPMVTSVGAPIPKLTK